MTSDSDGSDTPDRNSDAGDKPAGSGQWISLILFTGSLIPLFGFHPACIRMLGLRNEPPSYRTVYCALAVVLMMSGFLSKQRIFKVLGGVALLMLVLGILCPDVVS